MPKGTQDSSNSPDSNASAGGSSSASSSKKETEFTTADFAHLADNEHARYLENAKKIGHLAILTHADGERTGMQFSLPDDTDDVPEVRPLVNIEEVEPFRGMRRFRAETPDTHTKMYAKRFIDGTFKGDGGEEKLRIALFSPTNKKKGEEPFWGSIKPTPVFKENMSKAQKKELDAELAEIKTVIKGGDELVIEHASVPQRDLIKTRNPDQNKVMGESARDAYQNFFEKMSSELHPDLKARLKRAFEADIKKGILINSHRPEWLHLYGWSLMPMSKDPQRQDNLGAGPKWANTEMMILERIVKWFAINSPSSLLTIKPRFEMLLDSELIKHIDFETKVQIKDRYVKLALNIDPHLAFPSFRKASDLAQGAGIVHALLHGTKPASVESLGTAKRQTRSTTAAVAASSSSAFTTRKRKAEAGPLEAENEEKEPKPRKVDAAPAAPAQAAPIAAAKVEEKREKEEKARDKKNQTRAMYERSVAKIFTTSQQANYEVPWSASDEGSCTGSGGVTTDGKEKYIFTNAHVVENGVFYQIQLANSNKKYLAQCFLVAYQCDLALLKVPDPDFQAFAQPVEFGEMVGTEDQVLTVGFPMGGDRISVSKGIVSRVEVRDYVMSGLDMLQVQVDAAINPGNSGGPVFSKGKVIGVAFQGYDRQGLGFIIPIPIVKHFLTEAFSGKEFRGFPILPIVTETLGNVHRRKFYQLGKDQTGVRVKKIDTLCDAYNKLKENDILLKIDGYTISNQGTVDIPGTGKCLDMIHVTHMKYIGDEVKLTVLRKNAEGKAETMDIMVTLDHVPLETEKVGQVEHDKAATYYISSGISFMPLTRNYLQGRGSDLEEVYLMEEGCSLADAPKKRPDEQIVVIHDVLKCEDTEDYEDDINGIVKKINGKPINNIRDVVDAMDNHAGELHHIELASKSVIVVPNMSKAQLAKLLKRDRIPFDRSEDLMQLPPAVAAPAVVAAPAAAVPAVAAAPVEVKDAVMAAAPEAAASGGSRSPAHSGLFGGGSSSAQASPLAKPSLKRRRLRVHDSDNEMEDKSSNGKEEKKEEENALLARDADGLTAGQRRLKERLQGMEDHYKQFEKTDLEASKVGAVPEGDELVDWDKLSENDSDFDPDATQSEAEEEDDEEENEERHYASKKRGFGMFDSKSSKREKHEDDESRYKPRRKLG